MQDFDLFVIGGGINGCGIARDAVGRGFSVALAEMNDLASGTSSWSTKLIHGGLRYLEHYEFRLVREALMEREVLWGIAPHVVRPLRFVLPHHKGLRPTWLLKTGLFLYDHLGGRKELPATRTLNLRSGPYGAPLKPEFTTGFEYSDARVDDTRLVVLNARDAKARGAKIMVRHEVMQARRDGDRWIVAVRGPTGAVESFRARFLVNAAGPWVDRVIGAAMGRNDAHNIRLVQGSHIVMRKLFDHDRAYIFQNADGRIIFAIPYEDDFTLVGTTDKDFTGDPATAKITEEETNYLLNAASGYFRIPLLRENIVWSFSGVRPLFDDHATKAQEATRDYVLKVEGVDGEAPVLNIFGGKITTYRKLSEEAVGAVECYLGTRKAAWTGKAQLPGGNIRPADLGLLEARLQQLAPQLEERSVRRMVRAYGTDAIRLVEEAGGQLGKEIGHGLHEAEVDWMMREEWAETAEDVLWRRSKLGLRFAPDETANLALWMDRRRTRKEAAYAAE